MSPAPVTIDPVLVGQLEPASVFDLLIPAGGAQGQPGQAYHWFEGGSRRVLTVDGAIEQGFVSGIDQALILLLA